MIFGDKLWKVSKYKKCQELKENHHLLVEYEFI